MKATKSTMLSMLFALALASCKDDESPAPKARVSIQPTVNKQVTNKSGRTAAANDLVFTSGSIMITEVEFSAGRVDNGLAVNVIHEQEATIDFATGTITPAVIVEVPPGQYESIYLGIEIRDEDATPGIVIEGTYTNSNNQAIPVRFEFNSGEVFEAEADLAALDANQNVVAKISFDPQYWFATISAEQLDNATKVGGKILVNATTNVAIYSVVVERLDDATDAVFQ